MTDATTQAQPFPPIELANRVGSLRGAVDPLRYYDELGRETREGIVRALPANWTFHGKRVLDFGCGAGRTLRHFADEASEGEFWGCDIDDASIRWVEDHLPAFRVFTNGPEPPLDQPDESFDLIWAISVFSHLATSWSQWLTELNRILKPGGLLLATFMGRGMSQEIAGEPWDENLFGINVIRYGQSWDLGGPMVIHSPWWIAKHWGRGFEIVSLEPDGFASKPWLDHGTVLMRKRFASLEPRELERVDPGDEREIRAMVHNIAQLQRECADLRASHAGLEARADAHAKHEQTLATQLAQIKDAVADERKKTMIAEREAEVARQTSRHSASVLLEAEEIVAQSKARIFALEEAINVLEPRIERADRVIAGMSASLSWKLTAPLRALKRRR